MRARNLAVLMISATLTAACSAGNSDQSIPSNGAGSRISTDVGSSSHTPQEHQPGSIYVGDLGSTSVYTVNIPNKNNNPGHLCETVPGTPVGVKVDPHGNLWVETSGSSTSESIEFAPGCGSTKMTITDTDGRPADITFGKNGVIYVLNGSETSGLPTVDVYNGSGKLIRKLGNSNMGQSFGITRDASGNIFVSATDPSSSYGTVYEYPNGKMPGTQLLKMSTGPGNPLLDSAGNLLVPDNVNHVINVYAPPYNGSPTTYPLQNYSQFCAFSRLEERLYCADAKNNDIDVYSYPGLSYLYSFSNGLYQSGQHPFDDAVSPAAPF